MGQTDFQMLKINHCCILLGFWKLHTLNQNKTSEKCIKQRAQMVSFIQSWKEGNLTFTNNNNFYEHVLKQPNMYASIYALMNQYYKMLAITKPLQDITERTQKYVLNKPNKVVLNTGVSSDIDLLCHSVLAWMIFALPMRYIHYDRVKIKTKNFHLNSLVTQKSHYHVNNENKIA